MVDVTRRDIDRLSRAIDERRSQPRELTVLNGGIVLENSYAEYDSTNAPIRAVKDRENIVHLYGAVDPSGIGVLLGGTIFTLPPGWRPKYNGWWPVWGSPVQTIGINVGSDGAVDGSSGITAADTFVYIDSVRFEAAI